MRAGCPGYSHSPSTAVAVSPGAAAYNTVRLPGYARVDVAGFVKLTQQLRLQLNVENLLDKGYYINADSNTNISFGFPRAVRVGLTTNF